jgi:hypothetical protein
MYVTDVCSVLPAASASFQSSALRFLCEFATVPQDLDCLSLLFETASAIPAHPASISALLRHLADWPCFDISLFSSRFRGFVFHHFFTRCCMGFLAHVLMRIDDEGADIASLFGITARAVVDWVLQDDSESRQFALHVLARLVLSMPDDEADDALFHRFVAEAAPLAEQESFPIRAQVALAALVVGAKSAAIAAALLGESPGFWDGILPLLADDEDVAWAAMAFFLFVAEFVTGDARFVELGGHPAVEELREAWVDRVMAGTREMVRLAFLEAFQGREGSE